ncbi:hypothetical protein BGW80DRAFT_877612 [Lactifluus volemus]|nr:hypothetical protein BGW80DRAFT_877612 [Lactifluus volemus]
MDPLGFSHPTLCTFSTTFSAAVTSMESRHVIKFQAFSPSQSRASLCHLVHTPLLTPWARFLSACCVYFLKPGYPATCLWLAAFLSFNGPNV